MVSLLIVVAYYAILVVWFWHSIPQASARSHLVEHVVAALCLRAQ